MYTIWFYRTKGGRRPVEEYLADLEPRHRQRVAARLELLAQEGPELRRPYADVVDGPMRELRVGFARLEHRVFYYFVKSENVVLLHAFTKKTRQLPVREIETARERMKDLDRRLAAGEELE